MTTTSPNASNISSVQLPRLLPLTIFFFFFNDPAPPEISPLPLHDALPISHGLRLGLVSNTGRDLDAFVAHHGLEVDAVLGSRSFGRTKPPPTIFQAVLERLGVEPRSEEHTSELQSRSDFVCRLLL